MKNRPDVARRLLVALIRAARDVQGDKYLAPENLSAYSKYTDTPVETLRPMDPYEFDPDPGLDTQTLQDMQLEFIKEGVEQSQTPLSTEQYVSGTFLRAAVQQLGPAHN